MRMQILIWLYLLLHIDLKCFSTVLARNTRIIGGNDADITEFPYAVSFRWRSNNTHFCGGVILSQRHIVTAAHCVLDLQTKKNEVVIYAGSTSTENTYGTALLIKSIHINPEYTSNMCYEEMNRHDIAIIKVKQRIVFNQAQNKVELPTEDVKENDNVIICGWGVIDYPSYVPSKLLQKAPMKILDNSKCSVLVSFRVHHEQVCAFHAKGVGACTGDSGSPLIKNGKLVGISSFVNPCARGVPDLYIRIYPYTKFINSVINT